MRGEGGGASRCTPQVLGCFGREGRGREEARGGRLLPTFCRFFVRLRASLFLCFADRAGIAAGLVTSCLTAIKNYRKNEALEVHPHFEDRTSCQ